ncbi:hypothetical protein PSU4_33710 [Pseudonocardia sulfidoxydans NBRC 16205]|uniref:Beta-lactamase class A catalytic domain-containing protein n=1 Tax=Pseudonocardia sulfidoxydans NBRC 16205 TaxID=1223511 RepID=A0A511DIZ0_9PSEU|nr:serine hydrolase [Pseudonocardia sulfidoxydans]GEL24417.1 hypothetical protein PSU4_33710 [Pseudonocardia sulfidoxydans NBRC 16205]
MATRRPLALPLVLVAVAASIVMGEALDSRSAAGRAAAAAAVSVAGPGTPPADPGTPPADPGTPPADPGTPPADPGTPPADAGTTALSAAAVQAATRAVDEYATTTRATIAVAVRDTGHGQTSVGAAGAEPIYSASISKLYTVVSILHRADTGEVTLSDDDRDDIEAAMTTSDDNAMNALWERFGGPASIEQTIELAGLTDSAPPDDPSQWGETLISARDVVAVYDYVLTGLSAASRAVVLDALGAATPEGADGVDQAFGLLDPERDDGADAKQGWMYYGSRLYLHSTGLVGTGNRFLVAVLTVGPTSAGADAGRAVVDQAVAAALAPLTAE